MDLVVGSPFSLYVCIHIHRMCTFRTHTPQTPHLHIICTTPNTTRFVEKLSDPKWFLEKAKWFSKKAK